jgi:hypothetical protein
MKLTAVFASAVAAVAPPKISLDLAGVSNSYKLTTSIVRPHDQGLTQPSGAAVMSRQDWTEKCPAGASTAQTCPFPAANAYDHNDKALPVVTRVFLVDADGVTVNKQVKSVDFSKRSTYLFKYDASDKAGNHAEQVVFALILDDTVAPTISMCGNVAETVEAASSWSLCSTSVATDNIDGKVAIGYTVQAVTSGAILGRSVSYDKAKGLIDTKTVGRFLVTLDAKDGAGVYGHDAADNTVIAKKAILVKDTRAPWIEIHGGSPAIHECAVTYSDFGATAKDLLDTEALGKKLEVKVSNSVNSARVGEYSVSYNAEDFAGNKATIATRKVTVQDTTRPTVTLKGASNIVHHAGSKFTEPGVTTSDTCDSNLPTVGLKWVGRVFNDRKLGEYTREYKVADVSGNVGSATRKFTVVDNKEPIIEVIGGSETYEATRDVEYTDKGATCKDYVDGVLSHAVEVSGQVVNMRIPGTYKIRYDCQDLSGNSAVAMYRTVIIKDTKCPTLKLQGASVQYVEAGFPYIDAGATATDSLDGEISSKVHTDGDTVDTANAFYSRRSCHEIKKTYSGAKTGEYYITTYDESAKKYQRLLVWCDMDHVDTARTYYPVICGDRVTPYKSNDGSCAKVGLKMADFSSAKALTQAKAKFGAQYFPAAGATSDDYLCSTNDERMDPHITQTATHDQITRAEAGKYVIHFHVSDKAGNKECSTLQRTVIVRDTLPPVISLTLGNKLIHVSAADQTGIGGSKQPLKKWGLLMAESTTSVNGWLIGAAASAVAGVALLGMSTKATPVSVPV